MNRSAAATTACLVLGLLWSRTVHVVEAVDRIKVTEDGTLFKINAHDPAERPRAPYIIQFDRSGIGRSTYRFDSDLRVWFVQADTERYALRYRARDGMLRKVIRKDSGGRMLLNEEEDHEIFEDEADHDFEDAAVYNFEEADGEIIAFNGHHRRLYDCPDCEFDWDEVCDKGIPTVCNLEGNDAFDVLASASITVLCEALGTACSNLSADEACDGQCVG